jgi:hypothetical protein
LIAPSSPTANCTKAVTTLSAAANRTVRPLSSVTLIRAPPPAGSNPISRRVLILIGRARWHAFALEQTRVQTDSSIHFTLLFPRQMIIQNGIVLNDHLSSF